MGKRHQAFVIARILPHSSTTPKYRCIAAFHDQWCYGRLPLRATHRFITQVKRKNNATIISAEIAAVQGKFGRWGQAPPMPRIPCPFTAFLLATSWFVDLEDPERPYADGISCYRNSLDADMGSTQGDNNDGISVIDVTDPMAPSYCFVSICGLEVATASSLEVPDLVPLSAEQYVRCYYPKYTPPVHSGRTETEVEAMLHHRDLAVENDVQDAFAKLQDVGLIAWDMLAEAWPAEYDPDGKLDGAADPITGPVTSYLPLLADLTIPSAVAHAVRTGNTTDIEAMVWLPGKASAIKAALRRLCPFPDAGMDLLMKIVEKEASGSNAELDLTGFTHSSAQLEKLGSLTKEVDIVHLSNASIDGVRAVLTSFPQLKRLNLVQCPSIPSDSIYSLLHTEPHLFNHLEALIHPSLLLLEPKDAADCCPYRNAFSFFGVYTHSRQMCSLPFFTPSRVIQALIDTLQPLTGPDNFYSFSQSSFPMQAAFSSVRARGQKWSERDTVIIPQMSLAALKGEGWTFAVSANKYAPEPGRFAFLRFKSHSPMAEEEQPGGEGTAKGATSAQNKPVAEGWEIHDLASFINQVAADGKPRPSDEAVSQLQDILTALHTRLMGDEDVRQLIERVTFKFH